VVVNGSDHSDTEMDNWRVAVLGDGGVGKTALAVQVRSR
jgi:GTPase SAR1 family protein